MANRRSSDSRRLDLGADRNRELERANGAPPREASIRPWLAACRRSRLDNNGVKLFTGDLPDGDVVLIALVYSRREGK